MTSPSNPMLNDVYEAVFEDARGLEVIQIHNDGRELRVTIRGIVFTGSDFDQLSPADEQLDLAHALFTLQADALSSCRLEWLMPLLLEREGQAYPATLAATLVLGNPHPNTEELALEIRTPDVTIRTSGRSGWFEDEMLELASKLEGGTRIRSCITCAFSDYSPAGHGLFGDLACFRDAKEEYLRVKDKAGIFALWNRMTEYVQESYLCPEYRRRPPGTGYRG